MAAPLTTIPELATFTLLSTTTWLAIRLYVHRNGPVSWARRGMKINNTLYAILSLSMFISITMGESQPFIPAAHTPYIYHLSKFYEFTDILLVCAAGGPISLHFGFHHLTTPHLTFIRFLDGYEGWRVFSSANTFHHVLMYTYFAGALMLRPLLPWTGTVQLVVGIVVDLVIGARKCTEGEKDWQYFASAALLSVYFVLHLRDLRARRI
ncbi:hypothetical protein BJY01DRAFT_248484 [Aspergillus pseudoustus]|uniref:Uncharacterized protein n=1 Tax=Aspergillus pseudoustus TaxID=1810923 RepID=A0ABR4JUN3_9EURO